MATPGTSVVPPPLATLPAVAIGAASGACAASIFWQARASSGGSAGRSSSSSSSSSRSGSGTTSVGCVTLHAVIDENFTVAGFVPAATQRASLAEAFPVGKGISCSNALSSLGQAAATSVLVLCGTEDTGAYEAALAPHSFGEVRVVGGPPATRRHVTIIDPQSRATVTHVQVPGIPHPPELFAPAGAITRGVRAMAAVANGGRGGGLIALSGSLPKGAPVSYYATLAREIAAAGGRALLDTSGPALAAGLVARPFAVKPNRAEAEVLLGRSLGGTPRELAAAALEIQQRFGVAWVLLSNGSGGLVVLHGTAGAAAGCCCCCCHGAVELTAEEQSQIVNDQGCGDAVVAGFLAAFVSHHQGKAAAAAAAAAERGGRRQGAVGPTAEAVCRQMVLSGTANLFTPMPGELCPQILQRFGEQGAEAGRVRVERLAL